MKQTILQSFLVDKVNVFRAKWIGGGAMLMATAYFTITLPNFLFQPTPPQFNVSDIRVC